MKRRNMPAGIHSRCWVRSVRRKDGNILSAVLGMEVFGSSYGIVRSKNQMYVRIGIVMSCHVLKCAFQSVVKIAIDKVPCLLMQLWWTCFKGKHSMFWRRQCKSYVCGMETEPRYPRTLHVKSSAWHAHKDAIFFSYLHGQTIPSEERTQDLPHRSCLYSPESRNCFCSTSTEHFWRLRSISSAI